VKPLGIVINSLPIKIGRLGDMIAGACVGKGDAGR
jgi:hypothetical protein